MQAASAKVEVVAAGTAARSDGGGALLRAVFAPAAERIDALAGEWASLAHDAGEANAFAEHWFVAASLRHLGGDHVRLAEVRDGGALIGLMPLTIEQGYGRVPVRFVQNWRHHHLFYGAPLVRAGAEAAFWTGLLEGLDQSDWAPGFLHVRDIAEGGPLHRGLEQAALGLGRPSSVVYREARAFLESDLSADEYYAATVRKKKRKELARLRNRLAEQGALVTRAFGPGDDLAIWCDAFLRLEHSGWKGREGSALGCRAETEGFFRDCIAGAHAAGRLQLLAMDLDGVPIAMLVNFLTPPGSFSFKTAFDEAYARFSPGVLIQLDNLAILERGDIAWMDSCAAEDHPMIDSLWGERRGLARVTVPLSGRRRRLTHFAARSLETLSAAARRRRPQPPEGDAP